MAAFAFAAGRGARIMSLVGTAHAMSHVYMMCLPPMLPVLKDSLGTSYAALGFALTAFYLGAGLGQTPVGFIVDRIGGLRVLLLGLVVQSSAIGLIGLTSGYWSFLVLVALAGLAHAVYHPADYAILSSTLDRSVLGRMFSLHSLTGQIGSAATPLGIAALALLWDWRAAFLILGALGLAVALLVWLNGNMLDEAAPEEDRQPAKKKETLSVREGVGLLVSPPILLCFLFYLLLNSGFGAVRQFSVATLVEMFQAPLTFANGVLTGMMLGISAGVFIGGFAADRFGPRTTTAALGLVATAAALFLVAGLPMPATAAAGLLVAAGVSRGFVQGTRDLLVHSITPAGSYGKVFAFVTSGANLGSAVVAVAFGWILDRGDPSLIYWAGGVIVLVALVTFAGARKAAPG